MNSMNAAASMCAAEVLPQARPVRVHQQRPQALAAARDDVLGDLVDERHRALQACTHDRVDGLEIALNQGADGIEGHGRKCIRSAAFWPGPV